MKLKDLKPSKYDLVFFAGIAVLSFIYGYSIETKRLKEKREKENGTTK